MIDTFLSQLRAFQQMRITTMDPAQIQRASDQIKVSLVRMKSNLLPSNISWFVEFFTELLIQIGLIPMQELDDDIIKNVADNHRLQVCWSIILCCDLCHLHSINIDRILTVFA
jgi:hypothetical protein